MSELMPSGADGTGPLLAMLALLLTKHYLCDFVLQTPFQLRWKGVYGHPGGLLHAGLHAVLTLAVLVAFPVSWTFAFGAALAEFVVHYHIDWTKEQVIKRRITAQGGAFWALFGIDQLLHQLTYVLIAGLA